MMRAALLMTLLILSAAVGCNVEPSAPQPLTDLAPLTVEQWKLLPAEEKYDAATFERLRESDPSLRADRAWQKFMKEVVVPERKVDIPGVPGQS